MIALGDAGPGDQAIESVERLGLAGFEPRDLREPGIGVLLHALDHGHGGVSALGVAAHVVLSIESEVQLVLQRFHCSQQPDACIGLGFGMAVRLIRSSLDPNPR